MKVEPIATDKDAYDEYQREMQNEDMEAREHPTPTTQYESPIGPERPPTFREKIETKARDIKEDIKRAPSKAYESVKESIGKAKKQYEKNVEYERERAETERKVKSSPEYIRRKAEHEFIVEEQRARRSASAPRRRGSTISTPSLMTMGTYKPAYTGKSTSIGSGFGSGGYQPAFRGQVMAPPAPAPARVVKTHVHELKSKPIKITTFGSGAMPKIGNFAGTSIMPKIGGGGKKIDMPRIGGISFGTIPKMGSSITHKGSVKSLGLKTNIGMLGETPTFKLGETPKIGIGLKKKPVVKKKIKRSKKR
jgi:hypothetical protein